MGRKNNNLTSKLSYAVTGLQWTHNIRNSTDTTTSSRVRVPVNGCTNTLVRFPPVFVKDVERHCERCAHLPHKSLKNVNLYFEITKVCLLQNRLLRLSGFCVGGAHIFQDVFQHLSQKQEQNRYLSSVCFL